MPSRAATLVREFVTFVFVVAVSVVVAIGLGVAFSRLSGTAGEAAPAPALASDSTPGTAADEDPSAPKLRVVSSRFAPAATASGRQRRRARVSVRLTATAASAPVTLAGATLLVGPDTVERDVNAVRAAGALARPIPANGSATGEYRFETAGATTDRLAAQKQATLVVGAERLTLRLTTAR